MKRISMTFSFILALGVGAYVIASPPPPQIELGLSVESEIRVGEWADLVLEVYPDIEAALERFQLVIPNDVQVDAGSVDGQRTALDDARDLILLPPIQLYPDTPVGIRIPIRIDRAEEIEIRVQSEYGSAIRRFDLRPDLPCPAGQEFLRAYRECIPVGHECRKLAECGRVCWPREEPDGYKHAYFKTCQPEKYAAVQSQREYKGLREVIANPPQLKPYTPKRAKWMVLRIDQNRKTAKLEESGTYLLGAIENHQAELDEILNADPAMYARFIDIVDRFGQIAPRIANGNLDRGDLPELKDLQHESDGWLHELYRLSSKPLEHAFKKARNSEKQAVMKAL